MLSGFEKEPKFDGILAIGAESSIEGCVDQDLLHNTLYITHVRIRHKTVNQPVHYSHLVFVWRRLLDRYFQSQVKPAVSSGNVFI